MSSKIGTREDFCLWSYSAVTRLNGRRQRMGLSPPGKDLDHEGYDIVRIRADVSSACVDPSGLSFINP